MKKYQSAFAIAIFLMAGHCLFAQVETPKGFDSLFDGTKLDGWFEINSDEKREVAELSGDQRQAKLTQFKNVPVKFWRSENGQFICDDKDAPPLLTKRHFRDFELSIEVKTEGELEHPIGFGGNWKDGGFNSVRILQVGDRTRTWINDKIVHEDEIEPSSWQWELPSSASGPIHLYPVAEKTVFRNISVRDVGAGEGNRFLGKKYADQFEKVFNGTDFEGWAGPVDQYEIKDGVLRCKPHSGGTIYTKMEYTDFMVRFEFKLPAGGNNGLAIRHPGKGDTAYVGMCELQVLDNTAKKYATLDSRQFHGSAYGIAAADRGYLRPLGEWNFQEVTVEGSRIQVELNGKRILDADLSKIDKFLEDRPHPGKDRTSGHFGFAGHNDPVEFRNVLINDLRTPTADE